MFAFNWLVQARQRWILFDNKTVGVLTASRNEKAEQTHFPPSELIICCLWEVVEPPSLKCSKDAWTFHLGTWFSDGHRGVGFIAELNDPQVFSDLNDSVIRVQTSLAQDRLSSSTMEWKRSLGREKRSPVCSCLAQEKNVLLNMGKEGWTSSLQSVSCIYIKIHFPIWNKQHSIKTFLLFSKVFSFSHKTQRPWKVP